MRTLIKKWLGDGSTAPSSITETALLGEHLASIRKTAVEIRDFKEKTIYPTPTHAVRKKIDIEAAWPSSRQLFIQIFGVVNEVASRFELEPGSFVRGCGFENAVIAFIKTLDRITYGLVDALGTGKYAPSELVSIDERILLVQSGMNRLRKHVIEDFNYPVKQVRPTVTESYKTKPDNKIIPHPGLAIG